MKQGISHKMKCKQILKNIPSYKVTFQSRRKIHKWTTTFSKRTKEGGNMPSSPIYFQWMKEELYFFTRIVPSVNEYCQKMPIIPEINTWIKSVNFSLTGPLSWVRFYISGDYIIPCLHTDILTFRTLKSETFENSLFIK